MGSVFWPKEIVKKPRPFVALTGLNVDENSVHKSIWEGFLKIRRQDRASLNIKLFPIKHEYPKCKPKRNSYEWYVPKGILKSCWMQKHMEELPSLVVVFYDLDWDDIQWRDKINDCAALVNIVKKNLLGRSTKIVVVLVQKRGLMPGENTHTEQKAQMLCQVCELPGNRNLFVLPTAESLFGYIQRLEKEFQDLARDYYNGLVKKVKSHRESLNKTTHLLLYIRHQFKIGFYLEFRQDPTNALKNYKYAYNYLTELRLLDTHLLEIKTAAGYINYKICCLSFQNNASDAITQFRTHIDIFKGIAGNPELVFEHEAWISKQFEVMGDLFRDAIRQGLTAITTQNPGLYYEEAALHAIIRKSFSHTPSQIDSNIPSTINTTSTGKCLQNRHYQIQDSAYIHDDEVKSGPAENDDEKPPDNLWALLTRQQLGDQVCTEFYGQRAWRPGKQSIEIGDPVKEKEAIRILRILEKKLDHSKIIIPLLKSTIEYYQKYKANRMKLLSYVLMGEEHICAGDYSQASKCFSKVITEYRSEKWNSLLLPALMNILKCAYMTGNVAEYVLASFELIKNDSLVKFEEKKRIETNIQLVLKDKIPEHEPGVVLKDAMQGQEIWSNAIKTYSYDASKKEESIVSMDGIDSSIDCKIQFSTSKVPINQKVDLCIYLKSSTSFPLVLDDIEIVFTEPRYNERYYFVKDENKSDSFPITLPVKNQVTKIHYYVVPICEEMLHVIKVDKIRIQLGNLCNFGHVIMEWSVNMDFYHKQAYFPLEPIEFCSKNRDKSKPESDYGYLENSQIWNSINTVPFIELAGRDSLFSLQIKHADPVLINEHHPIEFQITNNEEVDIENINVSLLIEEAPSSSSKVRFIQDLIDVSSNPDLSSVNFSNKKIDLFINGMAKGREFRKSFAIMATSTGQIRIKFEVSYKIKIEFDTKYSNICNCTKSESISTNVIEPFEVMTKLLSTFMIPMSDIEINEPFLLQITSSNVSSVNLEIQKTEIILNEDIVLLDDQEDYDDRLKNEVVNSLEASCEVFMLNVPRDITEEYSYVAVGKYIIHWRRCMGDLSPLSNWNTTTITIPDCSLDLSPLSVDLDMNSHGICRTPFNLNYIIRNKTIYPIEIETQVEATDTFLFSGTKNQQIRVLPHSFYPIRICLLPLVPGFLSLPRLHIRHTAMPLVNVSDQSEQSLKLAVARQRRAEDKMLSRLPTTIFVKPNNYLF